MSKLKAKKKTTTNEKFLQEQLIFKKNASKSQAAVFSAFLFSFPFSVPVDANPNARRGQGVV